MDAFAARLSIDLDALAANFHTLSRAAPSAVCAAVVKADAYGLGAGPAARRLWAEGARDFFVARMSEGQALRSALGERDARIIVLDGAPAGSAPHLAAADLTPALGSVEQVAEWRAHAAHRPAFVHIDTGINRLGLSLDEAEALARAPGALRIAGVMSHLACADEAQHPMNALQLTRFKAAAALFPNVPASLSNSAGIFLGDETHFDMVRPGICLYGGGPRQRPDPRIRPVATFDAPVLQVRILRKGESLGYGAAHTAAQTQRVAVVAAGYADGVLRAMSPCGYGFVAGAARPLLGRMSMDMIAVDVTDAEAVRAGDRVQLFGPDLPLDDAANAAGTIAYELLVRASSRADRVYVGQAL